MRASMALALWLSSAAAARSLRVDVEGPLACDAEAPIRNALSEWTSAGSADPSPAHLTLRSPTPSLLVLDLVDPSSGAAVHRELELSAPDCSEVGTTVALLVKAWIRDLPLPVETPPPTAPPAGSPPPPRLPVRPPRTPARGDVSPAAPRVLALPPADAGAPDAAVATPAPTPDLTPTPTPTRPSPPGAAGPAAQPPRLQVEVNLGPAWNSGSSSFAPRLDVGGTWRLGGRLAAGLDLAAWYPILAAVGQGTVQAAIQSALLPMALSVRPDGTGPRFELALGIDHLAVSSVGLPITRSSSLWDAALTASAGWRLGVGTRGASLGADLLCGVRSHSEILTVDRVGDALRLSPIWVMVRVGVGWRLLSEEE